MQLKSALAMMAIGVALSCTMAHGKTLTPTLSGSFNSLDAKLYLECYGSKAPTVVVNSGFGGAGSQGGWEAVIKHISNSNRICLYDRANTGKSGRFDKHNDVGVMARQLDALLTKA